MGGPLAAALLLLSALTPPEIDTAISQAREQILELQRSSDTPGVQVAVALNGEVVWVEGFGRSDLESGSPVTEDTRFGIGSITKTLTMAVSARLVDRGRLAWDEPVATYLEDFPQPGAGITVRRIGSHLSGMADLPHERPTAAETARAVASAPLVHPPGEAHLYATDPFTVLAAAIEAVEGTPFPEVVARELTEPLGLRGTVPDDPREAMSSRTLFYVRSDGEPTAVESDAVGRMGGTGYLSTAKDLVLMGHALINTDFVSDESRAELLRDHRTNAGEPTFFGLGWRLGRTDEWGFFYGNSGGGTGVAASLLAVPKLGVTVAVVTNLTLAPAWPMTLGTAEVFTAAVEGARVIE